MWKIVRIFVMTPQHPSDAVPEADRLEQQTPYEPDLRADHEHPADLPEADLLEQEIPVTEGADAGAPLDDDRLEPLDDEWFTEEEEWLEPE